MNKKISKTLKLAVKVILIALSIFIFLEIVTILRRVSISTNVCTEYLHAIDAPSQRYLVILRERIRHCNLKDAPRNFVKQPKGIVNVIPPRFRVFLDNALPLSRYVNLIRIMDVLSNPNGDKCKSNRHVWASKARNIVKDIFESIESAEDYHRTDPELSIKKSWFSRFFNWQNITNILMAYVQEDPAIAGMRNTPNNILQERLLGRIDRLEQIEGL